MRNIIVIVLIMMSAPHISWAVTNSFGTFPQSENIRPTPTLSPTYLLKQQATPLFFKDLIDQYKKIEFRTPYRHPFAGFMMPPRPSIDCSNLDAMIRDLDTLYEMHDYLSDFIDDVKDEGGVVSDLVWDYDEDLEDLIDDLEYIIERCKKPLIALGMGYLYLKDPKHWMGYHGNGTPNGFSANGGANGNQFRFVGGISLQAKYQIIGVSSETTHVSLQQLHDMIANQRIKSCKELNIEISKRGLKLTIICEDFFGRKIQGPNDGAPVTPNDTYYKFEASAGKKVVKGLMKGLGALQGFGGGGISLGGGGGSKKGSADDQWGLWKVGFTPMDSPSSAWKIETGDGKPVVVAVIDSGLDITHPDLSLDNLWRNEGEIPGNFIDDDGNGYIDDTFGWNFIDWNNVPFDNNGHGTFVTGIIAAKSNNGRGIAGINQGVKIMPIKATNYIGDSNNFDIYRAIVYAVDNGASIINISIGGDGLSKLEQVGVDYAYDNGVLLVVAAGNQGKELVDYGPSGLQKVLTVAALDVSGRKRGSSNYGPTVGITAPGEEIISLRARETDFLKRLGGGSGILGEEGLYYKSTGSSFATPFVTGVASLMKAKDADITNREIEGVLMTSALDIEEPGLDVRSGAGLLNARGALTAVKDKILTARITRIEKVAEGKKIVSYKIYGVASGGSFKDYTLSVGKGKKPKQWSSVGSPSTETKNYDLLGIVDRSSMKGFGTWNVRLTVNGADGTVKEVYLPFPKK